MTDTDDPRRLVQEAREIAQRPTWERADDLRWVKDARPALAALAAALERALDREAELLTNEAHDHQTRLDLAARALAAEAERDEAVKLLRWCEWAQGSVTSENGNCPHCSMEVHDGHATDCRLAAFLARPPEENAT